MQSFPYAVENLAYAVRDQEAFLQASEQMMTGMFGLGGLFEIRASYRKGKQMRDVVGMFKVLIGQT